MLITINAKEKELDDWKELFGMLILDLSSYRRGSWRRVICGYWSGSGILDREFLEAVLISTPDLYYLACSDQLRRFGLVR